jgi:hypothetical protein
VRLSRIAALVVVGVLTLAALGGVWGVGILMLPQHDYDAVSMAQSMPSRPSLPELPLPSAAPQAVQEDPSLTLLPPLDPLPTPTPVDRPGNSGVAVPLNIEIRCDGEMDSICPEGTVEERRQCMQDKWRQLSPPCRQRAREQLVRMKMSLHQMRVACEGDVRRFCPDIEVGGGAVLQCLETHAQEVSDSCFQTLPKRGRLLR